MKYILVILLLSSCSTPQLLPTPEYIAPTPEYSGQQIVIMPAPHSDKVWTEDSVRNLVDRTFTFLSTALAIFFVEQAQQ